MMKQEEYRIAHIEKTSSDICCFTLAPTQLTIPFIAGQYFFLHLPSGEKAPFSMTNANPSQCEFHLRHSANNEVSLRFLNALQTQKTIIVSGPYGHCTLPQTITKPLVFVAGGTGIAPHKALIDEALKREPSIKIDLYWGISKVRDLYLNDWLEICKKNPNFNCHLILSEDNPQWTQGQGLVHDYFFKHHEKLSDSLVYASGPYAMIMALKEGYEKRDLSLDGLRSDML